MTRLVFITRSNLPDLAAGAVVFCAVTVPDMDRMHDIIALSPRISACD